MTTIKNAKKKMYNLFSIEYISTKMIYFYPFICLLVALGLPICDNWSFLAFVCSLGLLSINYKVSLKKNLVINGLIAIMAIIAVYLHSAHQKIEEGQQIFIPNNSHLQQIMPKPMWQSMMDDFEKIYPPSKQCKIGFNNCLEIQIPNQLSAFSSDGLWQKPKYSRQLNFVEIDSWSKARLGFTNDLRYHLSPNSNLNQSYPPSILWYEVNKELLNQQITSQGIIYLLYPDNSYEKLDNSKITTIPITAKLLGGKIFVPIFDENFYFAMDQKSYFIAYSILLLWLFLYIPHLKVWGVAASLYSRNNIVESKAKQFMNFLQRVASVAKSEQVVKNSLIMVILSFSVIFNIMNANHNFFGGVVPLGKAGSGSFQTTTTPQCLQKEGKKHLTLAKEINQELKAGNYKKLIRDEACFATYFDVLCQWIFGEGHYGYIVLIIAFSLLWLQLLNLVLPPSWTMSLWGIFMLTPVFWKVQFSCVSLLVDSLISNDIGLLAILLFLSGLLSWDKNKYLSSKLPFLRWTLAALSWPPLTVPVFFIALRQCWGQKINKRFLIETICAIVTIIPWSGFFTDYPFMIGFDNVWQNVQIYFQPWYRILCLSAVVLSFTKSKENLIKILSIFVLLGHIVNLFYIPGHVMANFVWALSFLISMNYFHNHILPYAKSFTSKLSF